MCADLSGKKLHRQVGVGRMVTSGSLGCIMVSTLPQECRRDVGSIPALGTVFPIFITPTILISKDFDLCIPTLVFNHMNFKLLDAD